MFPVSIPRVSKILAELLLCGRMWRNHFFSKVTRKISTFCNSVENFNTCTGLFQKETFLEIARRYILTGLAGLQSTICNTTKNKLQTKFLKGALKLKENLQEVISIGVPL